MNKWTVEPVKRHEGTLKTGGHGKEHTAYIAIDPQGVRREVFATRKAADNFLARVNA